MAPVYLSMDVSCGADEIRRALRRVRGVDEVKVFSATNRVVVTGNPDASAVRTRLETKLRRTVTIVCDAAAEMEKMKSTSSEDEEEEGEWTAARPIAEPASLRPVPQLPDYSTRPSYACYGGAPAGESSSYYHGYGGASCWGQQSTAASLPYYDPPMPSSGASAAGFYPGESSSSYHQGYGESSSYHQGYGGSSGWGQQSTAQYYDDPPMSSSHGGGSGHGGSVAGHEFTYEPNGPLDKLREDNADGCSIQ